MTAIEEKMTEQGVTGESIPNFDKRDLADFGFTNFNLRIAIAKQIRLLCEKYPREGDDQVGHDGPDIPTDTVDVIRNKEPPKEFLCPISNELMYDPVIAFDNITYDRTNIVKYLEEHSKSPSTGESDKDQRILNTLFPNRNLKKRIAAFRMVNDPSGKNYGMVDIE